MSARPLFKEIYTDLENRILDGSIKVGEKIYTEAEIMGKYNVSRITAMRALNMLAENEYIERKRRSGSFVINSQKKITISSIKHSGMHQHIALVSPFYSDSIISFIYGHVIRNAEKYNITASMHISNASIETERTVLKSFLMQKPDGILATPIEQTDNLNLYLQIHQSGIPIVFIDQYLPWVNIPYVVSDNYHAMYNLTDWAINQGFRKIAFLFGSIFKNTESQRLKGFIHAMQDGGLRLHDRFLINLDVPIIADNMQIYQLKEKLITEHFSFMIHTKQLPEIIMCVNDMTAAITIKSLKKLGVSVPGDLTVTGFDNDPLYNLLDFPFTTVTQNYDALGQKAMENLLTIKEGGQVPIESLIEAPLAIR
jgi:Transcriptional regulators